MLGSVVTGRHVDTPFQASLGVPAAIIGTKRASFNAERFSNTELPKATVFSET
jgi:hypothetical protein